MTYQTGYAAATCSLTRLKRQISTQQNSDDDLLTSLIYAASAELEAGCLRSFVEYRATRLYDTPASYYLPLDEDCIAVESVADARGTISSGQYLVTPYNSPAKQSIELMAIAGSWQFGSERRAAISVTGLWGYRGSARWQPRTVLTAGIDAVVETVTVNSVSAISVLDYLLIGSEMMLVLGVDSDTNQLTVERGSRGTTASAAVGSATVKRLLLPELLLNATAMLAVYFYERRDNPSNEPVQMPDGKLVFTDYVPRPVKTFASLHHRMPRIRST